MEILIRRDPLLPALDGHDLTWLIDRYLESCRERLETAVTTDGYTYQLWWFAGWWEMAGPERGWLLRPADFTRFERHLRSAVSVHTGRLLSYHTRHTILKRVKEMFKWAVQAGYLERDFSGWVPAALGSPPQRRAASISSLRRLLDLASTTREPQRDRAILAMLMGMGLRREEVSRLDVEDVVVMADYSGYAHVTGKRTKANPSGERDAAFDSATGAILVEYLDAYKRRHGPLFEGLHGGRLTGQGVYKLVKRLVAAAGLKDAIVGPHDLRRAFATHYRRARPDKSSADLLRRQMGHASYSQTDEYTLLEVDDIRLDIVSPLSLLAEG